MTDATFTFRVDEELKARFAEAAKATGVQRAHRPGVGGRA